jgi:two-component system chemotaxis response regulator CheB
MHHDIIVIGGSAGAVDPLLQLVGRLPSGLRAALFAVLHIAPSSKGELAGLIQRAGALPCALAEDGEPIREGRIYLARPDHHLLLEAGRVRVVHGPKENLVRPAIDPLFRSAAAAYGPRVIGVILSGMLDDGAQGLAAIKRAGGLTVVQHPKDARFPSMPLSATLAAGPQYRVPIGEMPDLLARLCAEPVAAPAEASATASAGNGPAAPGAGGPPTPGEGPGAEDPPDGADPSGIAKDRAESEVAANALMTEEAMRELGQPSVFTCPDCGGILFEIEDSGMPRYRCSIGHAYGAQSLAAGKDAKVEEALSAALRALQESERLSRRLMANLHEKDFPLTLKELQAKAEAQERHARLIRELLAGMSGTGFLPEGD